jgi:hypothetical protein
MRGLGFDHRGQVVARFEEGCNDVGIHHEQSSTNPLQDRLDAMSELGDDPQAHHARGALQAVGRAECLVEVGAVGLAPLEIHQPFLKAD